MSFLKSLLIYVNFYYHIIIYLYIAVSILPIIEAQTETAVHDSYYPASPFFMSEFRGNACFQCGLCAHSSDFMLVPACAHKLFSLVIII